MIIYCCAKTPGLSVMPTLHYVMVALTLISFGTLRASETFNVLSEYVSTDTAGLLTNTLKRICLQ